MFETLKTSDLSENNRGVLRAATRTRPPIWLVEENGKTAVVKDYSSKGFLYRNLAARFLIWRESKALRLLEGIEGIPKLYRVIDGVALVIENIPGRDLEKLEREIVMGRQNRVPDVEINGRRLLSENFFKALQEIVEKVHERGVVHCDLKRTPNILIGNDGLPYIVDWASFMHEREFRFFPFNIVYRRFLKDDFDAVIKHKVHNRPDIATVEEKSIYEIYKRGREKRGPERAIRAVRAWLREMIKKLA